MSGRKSSEVNGLLARGRDARNAGTGNFLNSFHLLKAISSNQKEIEEIHDRIDSQKLEITPESKQEFPQESKQIQEQFDNIKKENVKVDYTKDIKEAEAEKRRIDEELQSADQEQDRIAARIRSKSHYCDNEYRDARKLVKKYQENAEAKTSLMTKIARMFQDSKQKLLKKKNLDSRREQVVSKSKELNEKAAKITELRKKAVDAKSYIQDAFRKIDTGLAEKFMKTGYAALKKEVDSFKSLVDAAVVEKVSHLSEEISIFSNQLDQRYSDYLARFEEVEDAIKGNKNSLGTGSASYADPMDYAKNKEDASKISVLDYLKEYSDKHDLIDAINNGIKKAEDLFEAENFDAAEQQAEENTKMIEQAQEYASLLQEHMITNYYTVKDMRRVMKQMGFEVGAYKIDGHIKNGWTISASNPNGEKIDFTKIYVDDEGKPKIDIDHKTTGDCPAKWSEITAAFEEIGVFMETIKMENGKIVMDKRGAKADTDVVGEAGKDVIVQH